MGILFAFIALFCWGVGDFLIQKSSREFGKWIALFFITFIAVVALTPFVYKDLAGLFINYPALAILMLASIVILVAALFNFQAFIDGKISVVEPIMAFEVAVTAILSFVFIGERLSWLQLVFIILLVAGIFLVSTKSFHHLKKIKAEKGVWLAFFGTLCMGTTNFLFGVGSRETNPLLINWFTSLFLALVCFIYLVSKSKVREIFKDWHKDKSLIIGVGLLDNAAWIAYSYSTLYIPITIAIGISESYIALAALLGLVLNGEKLRKHQFIGLALAILCAIALALVTPD
ncbi:MAG: DMT family transporter [Candidatus Magasanikbacteria bacterium]|nr:DMT family transporter [Candidatus Magasanikbacteria bacterium]